MVAAADSMGLPTAFMQGVRDGLDKLYLRDYGGMQAYFAEVGEQNHQPYLGAVAECMVWQAKMLENFDFRYDKPYKAATKRARIALDAATSEPGNEAWEEFMLGGVVGMEGMHAARQESYISALQLGLEAMDHISKARELAPDFRDLQLADGIYNYWRTVLTDQIKVLPDYGDHRSEGLAQMGQVAQDGAILGPPARFALTFSWVEEARLDDAIATCKVNQEAYPDNVINNLLLGRIQISDQQPTDAIDTLDHVVRVDPSNFRVHYYRSIALYRLDRSEEAEAELGQFLATEGLDDDSLGYGYYRYGELLERRGDLERAELMYEKAVKLANVASAKTRLDDLRQKRKDAEG